MDYAPLTTRALCDQATAEIDFELETFTVRDANADLSDKRAERTQTSVAAQLALVQAKIAVADSILAAPGLDADTIEQHTDERDAYVVQRKKLEKRARRVSGLSEFLADVDAEQNAAQVTLLTTIRAGIAAHRATLPA